jgi:hypothetical protein
MLYSSQLNNQRFSSPANESCAGKWADQTSQRLHATQLIFGEETTNTRGSDLLGRR